MREHDEAEQQAKEATGSGFLSKAAGMAKSVKEKAQSSADVMTGADLRRFDEFTDAATTAVVGLHRDQVELRERLDRLEQSVDGIRRGQAVLAESLARVERSVRSQDGPEESRVARWRLWGIAFGIVSLSALLLSIVAILVGLL